MEDYDDTMTGLEEFDDGMFDTKPTEPEEVKTDTEEVEGQTEEANTDEESTEEEPTEYDWDEEVTFSIGEESVGAKLSDLRDAYITREATNTMKTQLEAVANQLVDQRRENIKALELAKLETDLIIADADKMDMDNLSGDEFRKVYQLKQSQKQRAEMIQAELNKQRGTVDSVDTTKLQEQARQTHAKLLKEVPDFSIDGYNQALQFAVTELGIDENVAKNTTDAGIIKALILAHRASKPVTQTVATTTPAKRPLKTVNKVGKAPEKKVDLSTQDGLMDYFGDIFG